MVKLQERLEKFLKDENLSQAKAAPILGISQAALSQYRRSMYDKGDIEAVENKLKEFFQIQEEKTQNAQKAEPFRTKTSAGYIPTTISEEAYKLIRYCQLEKGMGYSSQLPIIAKVITGLILSSGSTGVHELVAKLRESRVDS